MLSSCKSLNKLILIKYSLRSNSNTTLINAISVGILSLRMLFDMSKIFISVNNPTSDGIWPVRLLPPGQGVQSIVLRFLLTKSITITFLLIIINSPTLNFVRDIIFPTCDGIVPVKSFHPVLHSFKDL